MFIVWLMHLLILNGVTFKESAFLNVILRKGAFNNNVDRILTFFDPTPCVDSFYTLSMDKNSQFLTPFILST